MVSAGFLTQSWAAGLSVQGKKAPVESSETMFVKSTIDLHDKYLLYVNDCFANSSLFHKAVKEVRPRPSRPSLWG